VSIAAVVVTSLGDLIDKVTPPAPDPATGRRRDTGVYRGAADARWPLLTTLDRLGGVRPPHTKANLEEHILRNFVRYSRPYLTTPPANEWELLVQAQHHGLPTRLLDWAYSPLVAAHFATLAHEPGGDAAVWRLDWQQLHRHFGFPPLALLIEDLGSIFPGDRPFTPWALFAGTRSPKPFAFMLEPPSLGARIASQSATFTICSDKQCSFDRFLEEHGLAGALTKFVIPEAEVSRLRDQLDLVGVDERRLFPDLDGVADQLRRYYS
jgi:hypothetical protein